MGRTQAGAAVLARTHLAVLNYPGTPLVPLAGLGRVTACHVGAGPRGGSIHVSTYLWAGEGLSQRNFDIMWAVAEWIVAIGRPFIWGGYFQGPPQGRLPLNQEARAGNPLGEQPAYPSY